MSRASRLENGGGSHRRLGFTLTEIMVTMTASSMVMATAASLLHRSLSLESATRHVLERERTALMLARQFRGDIRRAVRVTTAGDTLPEGTLFRAELSDGESIEYRAAPDRLIREASLADGSVAREEYACAGGAGWSVVREGRLMILRTDAREHPTAAPPVAIEAVAILGARSSRPETGP